LHYALWLAELRDGDVAEELIKHSSVIAKPLFIEQRLFLIFLIWAPDPHLAGSLFVSVYGGGSGGIRSFVETR
jgi:hypothetical protein